MKPGSFKNSQQQEINSFQSDYDESSEEVSEQFQNVESDDNQIKSYQNDSDLQRKKQELLQMQQKNIKTQLKQIPFGQILKYRELKKQIQTSNKRQIIKDRSKRETPAQLQKHDKNASKQIKIMKMPPKKKIKQIFQSQRPKSIDPRFQNYAGNYNEDLASKSYGFIKEMQKNQIDYLKKKINNKKLSEQERQIMLKNYNKVTNDMKRYENQQIQKKVKATFRHKNFNLKRSQFKQQIQKAKIDNLDFKSQDKRLKKKEKKIQKQRTIQRKQFMNNVGRK